jgi:glycosyltransferase involved in cell wall biosynthesis
MSVVNSLTGSDPSIQANLSVSVVVPCLNEARNLPYVFSRMPAGVSEVVFVDGGSTDGSVQRARELWPSLVVVHQTRTGKGNALACGFAACTGDIVVMLDADGSTDPAEIPRFIAPLFDGADFVKGSRFLPGGGSSDITRLRHIGNTVLCGFVNRLFHTRYSDLCYGYNAFWRRALPYLNLPDPEAIAPNAQMLWGDGFEVETLINIRIATTKLRVAEVPSMEAARLHGVSNLNAYADGRRVLSTILQEFRRRKNPVATMPPALASSPASAARSSAAPSVVSSEPVVVPAVTRIEPRVPMQPTAMHFSERIVLEPSHEPVAVTGEG